MTTAIILSGLTVLIANFKGATMIDVIKYLKKVLKTDPHKDEILEYVAELERKAESLAKIRAAQKRYETRHPEKAKQYYEQNKEKRIKESIQWRKANPEKVKQYALKNKDKKREYMKKWRKAHPDYMRNYYQKLKQGGKDD